MDQENTLIERLANEGISIYEADIPEWGRYVKTHRLILLRKGMTGPQRLATLHHEAIHHWRGDNGHQTIKVENLINRQVAQLLITPSMYAYAERLHGPNLGAIAWELSLPRWVIEAYTQTLTRVH